MILSDFKCSECGTTTENLVEFTVTEVNCENCGGLATRVISTPKFKLDGCDPGFPTAYEQWEKDRKRRLARELKSD